MLEGLIINDRAVGIQQEHFSVRNLNVKLGKRWKSEHDNKEGEEEEKVKKKRENDNPIFGFQSSGKRHPRDQVLFYWEFLIDGQERFAVSAH